MHVQVVTYRLAESGVSDAGDLGPDGNDGYQPLA
jgi:hypothetical protein